MVLLRRYRRRDRTHAGELHTRILRNDLGDPRYHERDRAAVVVLAQKWNRFAAESPYFAIRQNRFQPVANLGSVAVFLCGQQDQHTAICGFAADSPFLVQIDGIALDIGAIERLNGDNGDLRMRLLVDLPADVIELRDCGLVENVREIVDVVRRV